VATLVRFETIATVTKQIVVERIMSCRRVTWSSHWFTLGALRDDPAQSASIILALRATLIGRRMRTVTFSPEWSVSIIAQAEVIGSFRFGAR
jgi:hypothetical protein